jgi:hypothetical protein
VTVIVVDNLRTFSLIFARLDYVDLFVTYLFTSPWSRVLEKLAGLHLAKKCPAFNGTLKFITAFTSACHLSLS